MIDDGGKLSARDVTGPFGAYVKGKPLRPRSVDGYSEGRGDNSGNYNRNDRYGGGDDSRNY